MGCDIHSVATRTTEDGWEALPGAPAFPGRSYSVFGFMAGVRNYSAVAPISEPRGLPEGFKMDADDYYYGHSWLSLDELEAYDYDQVVENRRCTEGWDGGATCAPGDGAKMPLREHLGEFFLTWVRELREAGADRIVFWFDN